TLCHGTQRSIRSFPTRRSSDLKAEVRKEGFFLLTGQTFTLHAGSNELSLLLNHEQEVRENVQVTAPSNQIDAKDTTHRSTLSARSEEHTSELQSLAYLVCRLLL